jgi:uncharacterized protein (TIGR02452 family)
MGCSMQTNYGNVAIAGAFSLSAIVVGDAVSALGMGQLSLASGSTVLFYALGHSSPWMDQKEGALVAGAKNTACIIAGLWTSHSILTLSNNVGWSIKQATVWGSTELLIATFYHQLSQPRVGKPPKITWTLGKRAEVFQETIKCIKAGEYRAPSGQIWPLRDGITLSAESKLIEGETPAPGSPHELTIRVVEGDCLDVAQKCARFGKTALLLFASTREAGGGMSDGTNGQEEHICYRSEMSGFMEHQLYLFDASFYNGELGERLIHTPKVQVFRASQANDFACLDVPYTLGILSQAAPVKPPLKDGGYANIADREKLDRLILTQLGVACKAGYQRLVLGAFGCGAFGNPVRVVARRYRELIENHDLGTLKEIVFAIQGDGNFEPFRQILAT